MTDYFDQELRRDIDTLIAKLRVSAHRKRADAKQRTMSNIDAFQQEVQASSFLSQPRRLYFATEPAVIELLLNGTALTERATCTVRE